MKKKYIIIGIIVIGIVLSIPITKMLFNKKETKEISMIDHKKVEGLYVKNDDLCTDITNEENIDLFLTFGQMKKDNLLKDNIDMSTYKKEANKITKNIKDSFTYTYEGYKYISNGNTITKEKVSCDKGYVSKLYGYSEGKDKLYLTIKSGYIIETKVYDLEGNEIGSKDNLNSSLDRGTTNSYTYLKEGNSYKFEKVE